ncbi:nucleoside triphosphate pyrophosphohydrolase [Sphingosinicella microcystinivorans]|uniref:nucleoside triphosphate pyrophosphohydrolase n=1 Tax=Sphingosinicella microcystinivorans TaxID=335406 RepID=UPI0022F3962A|nr:nucleoside triphosphate pyrophosphohydrolase [Sphingosinicella microcystinivorans]WBX83310.1 nucleoside triphosphate pyrophosphohydrolase [Sphingosinicella microcystinivorans]
MSKETAPEAYARLADVMRALRDPARGCPWDIEQDFASIAPYTIEEAHEVADAIARGDMADLQGELGDLLLQVVYHAQMAAEAGHFTLADVTSGITDKMVRRHPHVFGDASVADADAQTAAWEDQKARERGNRGALAGVALGLPALMRAQKLQRRAARVGFDWPDAAGPRAKINEELAEVETADDASRAGEIGDLLFAVVNYARHLGIDAEETLRAANAKFERRFNAVEAIADKPLPDMDIEALEALWQRVKAAERS